MKKVFFLDTNVLLHDPRSIFKLGDNDIVISSVVLEELDSKKRLQDGVGRNAREFSRILKEMRKGHEGELNTGIPLESGGTFRVELNHRSFELIKDIFPEVNNDNRIIAVALNVNAEIEENLPPVKRNEIAAIREQVRVGNIKQKEAFDLIAEIKGVDVILITNDSLMLSKVDAIGKIKVEEYENDRLIDSYDSVHAGYHEIFIEKQYIDEFYEKGSLSFEKIKGSIPDRNYFLQDYFIVKDSGGTSSSFIARLRNNSNQWTLTRMYNYNEKNLVWGINARNVQQKMLFDLLLDHDINLVMVTGVAGTGKTLISLASALQQTEDDQLYKKILVARPVIPMGKDIGFLPGEKEDKLRPWMQPIYDNLEFLFDIDNNDVEGKEATKNGKTPRKSGPKKTIDEVIDNLNMEIEALTYIRGRSIPDVFIIIDEAQNLSPHEVKTIISRAGVGAKVVLLGDPEQIDHPYLDSINNGLTYAVERMKQEDDTGIIALKTTERSKLAEKAARLL